MVRDKMFYEKACAGLIVCLLFSPLLVSAEFVPSEARKVAGTLHSPDEVISYVNDNFVYSYAFEQRSFYHVWKYELGDCTEFNHVLGAYFLSEQGVRFTKVSGWADCGAGRVRHDWLMLEDGSVFDVMEWCHGYGRSR